MTAGPDRTGASVYKTASHYPNHIIYNFSTNALSLLVLADVYKYVKVSRKRTKQKKHTT